LEDVAYLLLENSRIQNTNNVLEKAAASNKSAIMKLLQDRKGDEVKVTDSVVQEAAANEGSGVAIMKLLIGWRTEEIEIANEVMQNVARNGKCGLGIIKNLVACLSGGERSHDHGQGLGISRSELVELTGHYTVFYRRKVSQRE
jgi:hypothetical protein